MAPKWFDHWTVYMGRAISSLSMVGIFHVYKQTENQLQTRIWANAQRDGRNAKYRWRPLFNAAKIA